MRHALFAGTLTTFAVTSAIGQAPAPFTLTRDLHVDADGLQGNVRYRSDRRVQGR